MTKLKRQKIGLAVTSISHRYPQINLLWPLVFNYKMHFFMNYWKCLHSHGREIHFKFSSSSFIENAQGPFIE